MINWTNRRLDWTFDVNHRLIKLMATPSGEPDREREQYITILKDKRHDKYGHSMEGMIGEYLDEWYDYER